MDYYYYYSNIIDYYYDYYITIIFQWSFDNPEKPLELFPHSAKGGAVELGCSDLYAAGY